MNIISVVYKNKKVAMNFNIPQFNNLSKLMDGNNGIKISQKIFFQFNEWTTHIIICNMFY